MDEARRHDFLALAFLTALIALFFIDVLAGTRVLADRDLLQYSYPTKKFLRETVLQGEFPYWNRSVSAGQPMAANPAHEVFYPLTWLILLPSYDYGFQLFILLHLFIAAWGMYALLRSLDLEPPSAFLGAFSFLLGGLYLSYITLLPFLASVTWLPLVCLFARRYVLTRTRRDLLFAALFFALQVVIGEPTTILQTGILLGLYAIHKRGARGVIPIGAISISALLLGAVQALPMLDHARGSIRARGITFSNVIDWSAPFARIGELFDPHFLGYTLLDGRAVYWAAGLYGNRSGPFLASIYPGLLLVVLAIAGLIARARGTRLVLTIVAISFFVALGAHTPLWRWLYDAGLAKSIRYPEKFLLMGIFALTVFGARMLDTMLRGDERLRVIAARVATAVAIVAAAGAVIASTPWHAQLFAAVWQPSTRFFETMLEVSRNAWWTSVLRGILLVVLLRVFPRMKAQARVGLCLVFILGDLGPRLPELAARHDPEFLSTPSPVLAELPGNHSEYRLFHQAMQHVNHAEVLPYFLNDPGQEWIARNAALPVMPAGAGVQTAIEDDFDSTSLLPSADFSKSVWDLSDRRPDWVTVAASMSNVWYRVVFVDPQQAFARARGDLRIIRPVRILPLPHAPRYSFAQHLVPVRDREDFVAKIGTGPYERTAYVMAPAFTPAPGRVNAVRETANTARVEADTEGRAFLVISVTPHKYWRITVDGRDAEAVVTNVGYQGVIVPEAGHHVIEMRYRNPLIAAGAAISIAALLALLAITMRAL